MNRNNRQRVLDLMQSGSPRRELYEGAARDGKVGSGWFYLTYSADLDYQPLDKDDIQNLLANGFIKEKYDGCYVLAY